MLSEIKELKDKLKEVTLRGRMEARVLGNNFMYPFPVSASFSEKTECLMTRTGKPCLAFNKHNYKGKFLHFIMRHHLLVYSLSKKYTRGWSIRKVQTREYDPNFSQGIKSEWKQVYYKT